MATEQNKDQRQYEINDEEREASSLYYHYYGINLQD